MVRPLAVLLLLVADPSHTHTPTCVHVCTQPVLPNVHVTINRPILGSTGIHFSCIKPINIRSTVLNVQ